MSTVEKFTPSLFLKIKSTPEILNTLRRNFSGRPKEIPPPPKGRGQFFPHPHLLGAMKMD
jgi:hypothetical protein